MIGDILAQKITGGDGLDAFRSFKLGAIGAGLDIFRQDWAGKAEEVKDGRLAQAAKAVTAQASWGPIVACGMYAAIKVAEGNPGEIVQGVEVRKKALKGGTCFLTASRLGVWISPLFWPGSSMDFELLLITLDITSQPPKLGSAYGAFRS